MTPQEFIASLTSSREGRAFLSALGYLKNQPMNRAANVTEHSNMGAKVVRSLMDIYQNTLSRSDGSQLVTLWMTNLVTVARTDKTQDATLRLFATQLQAVGEPLPKPLLDYMNDFPKPIEIKREKRGPDPVNLHYRNLAIIRAVGWIVSKHGLKATRNYAARHKPGAAESACSIVSKALTLMNSARSEDEIQKIFKAAENRRNHKAN